MATIAPLRPGTVWLLAGLSSLAVSSALAQQPAAAAPQWPPWLVEAMGKESGKLRASKVVLEDGAIRTRLAGKPIGAPQPIEDGWYIPTDIGTESPLECWAFTTIIDPAAMANNIAELSMQSSAQANGPLGERGLYHVEAGAYEDTPYLALEWFYSVGEAPEKLVGLAKVRVAIHKNFSFACAHNFLGYRETFASAFEQFVTEADLESGAPAPYYEEVVLQRIGDQTIGFSRSTFTLDADGDTEIMTLESTLVPVDNATLSTSDTWYFGFSRPDGTLINQQVAQSDNGELTMSLALQPEDDGAWSVSGTFQGKEIAHELDDPAEPMSELGQMLAIQDLLADTDRHTTALEVWVPAADPTRFLRAEFALEPEAHGEGRGLLTLGPITMSTQFDRSGSLLNGTYEAGAAQVVLERIWVRGSAL